MSTKTRQEVMAKLTQKHVAAGAEYRVKLIDQAVKLTGCHRKSAIRALNKKPRPKKERAPGIKTGRPREYHSDTLLPVLKPIWFAANRPCGCRLRAMLPEWIPAYEADHFRLDRDVRSAPSAVPISKQDTAGAVPALTTRRKPGTLCSSAQAAPRQIQDCPKRQRTARTVRTVPARCVGTGDSADRESRGRAA